MKILVLGSGTGRPAACHGDAACTARCRALDAASPTVCTHASLAVSADGERWVLLNAGHGLGDRIRAEPALQRRGGALPVAGVVLLDAQMEHVSGLLSLRNGPPIELHCTPCVFEDLTSGLPLLPLLQHYCGVRWHVLPVAGDRLSAGFRVERAPGLRFLAVAIDGTAPAHAPHHHDPETGDHLGMVVEDEATGERLLFAPGLADADAAAHAALIDATELLLDSVM